MAEWFRVIDLPENTRITFKPSCDRFWPPDVLGRFPLPREKMRGRHIVLDGAGAVWMYAHAAALAGAEHACDVTVDRKGKNEAEDSLVGCRCELLPKDGLRSERLLYMSLRATPAVADAAVRKLVARQLDALRDTPPRDLVLAGRAGVDLYARAAYTAVKAGVRRVFCWSARDGLILVYDADGASLGRVENMPSWLEEHFPKPSRSIVVGVAGDPNRGKSVFSRVLDWDRAKKGIDGWMLDCDGQSPTPRWYLAGLSSEEAEQVNALRDECKRDWTPSMEALIASQLRRARRWFDVLIADLPGGKHNQKPPQRIPAGREQMFREIDALILLDDEENSTESHWRRALSVHGLEDRIAVVLRSGSPWDIPATLTLESLEGVCRGRITGLNRGRDPSELGREMQDSLDAIWQAVMASAEHNRPRQF